jgi:hypothetical protein
MPKFQIPMDLETGNFKLEKDLSLRFKRVRPTAGFKPHKIVYGDYYFLNEELSSWMIENNVEYRIEFYGFHEFDKPWFIVIEDLEKAMLYKLSWC